MWEEQSWSVLSPHKVQVVPFLIGNLGELFLINLFFHLDRTNEARKSGSNGGNSLRLSHPVFLAPKEKHWAGDLLKFVLRGLFAPVHSKILLGCGEVVGSKLLCVHSLAKVVDVARAGSRWLMGNNFL